MAIDILIDDTRWRSINVIDLVNQAYVKTITCFGLSADSCESALVASNDRRISKLNAQHRDQNKPTNVLSWPTDELRAEIDGDLPKPPKPDPDDVYHLGDIVISYDSCEREAIFERKSLSDHTTHLFVHGLLHLLGYDHHRELDAALMEQTEIEILATMGLADPYIAR
ncbi:MAG: rRNA maturation RNase YbeY [Aestuariivita sp.]|nr:rRNA maturation RNase YbeY [Aestuariivita sp.]MCY4346832.1 rRNA maturation RNase YbeY [Aestuariivita sp.]